MFDSGVRRLFGDGVALFNCNAVRPIADGLTSILSALLLLICSDACMLEGWCCGCSGGWCASVDNDTMALSLSSSSSPPPSPATEWRCLRD